MLYHPPLQSLSILQETGLTVKPRQFQTHCQTHGYLQYPAKTTQARDGLPSNDLLCEKTSQYATGKGGHPVTR